VNLDGDLDIQLNRVQTITGKLQPLQSSLQKIAELDRQCEEANTEENDYTIYSVEDLKFELTLVQKAVQKKSAFIENQIVSRNMTNLTPAQLEEFESTFRYFDKDNSNSLSVAELSAAIASLGFFYEDKEFDRIFSQIAEGQSEASFEQFIHYMVSVTEDKATPEQLCQSFRAIAGDKPYVTELDLKMCMVPVPVIETLKQTMPKSNQDGYDYTAWVNSVFK